ncbi:MAG: 16S rRNA (cytidine(1402)-2'-O)-methyltransferase [Saccharofermentanales bacterium]|jgi:16S rRNA (cytidine1402-2'-O)-methyltransferase
MDPANVTPGTLYLVATPMGNVGDLSPRAKAVLDGVDYIAAEDTRRAVRLLSSLGIGNRLISYYEHNQARRHDRLLADLGDGQSIAVISDAGMPCIADPGEGIVRLAVEAGIPISVVPGPSALLSALAASGFDTTHFVFEGFIAPKGRDRRDKIEAIAREGRTVVFYEAPHRIERTLDDLRAAGLGDRRIVIGREMTKTYEEFLRFTVDDGIAHFRDVPPRGEMTVVVEGLDAHRRRTDDGRPTWDEDDARRRLAEAFREGASVRDAVDRVADEMDVGRNALYDLALEVRDG